MDTIITVQYFLINVGIAFYCTASSYFIFFTVSIFDIYFQNEMKNYNFKVLSHSV